MNTSSFAFPGVETPPDPVDGSIADALHLILNGAEHDLADAVRRFRAELRRMDIEIIPVVRLTDSRRLSDTVRLSTYTQVLAQRNAALQALAVRDVEIAGLKSEIDTFITQLGDLRADLARLEPTEGR